jgi:hypothetical protein
MQKSLFQILPFLLILSLSCGESEEVSNFKKNEEKGISLINSIIQITGQDFNKGSSSSGFVKGEAVMKIIPSESDVQVIVKYRYLMSSGIQEATERGHLENFVITDDGVNNTKVIRADWINQDAGNGTFVLKSYNEDEPKTIIAQINAKGDGNWYHSTWVELTDEEYDKFLKAVSVNEENRMSEDLSVTQLNKEDIIPEASYAKEWEKLNSEIIDSLFFTDGYAKYKFIIKDIKLKIIYQYSDFEDFEFATLKNKKIIVPLNRLPYEGMKADEIFKIVKNKLCVFNPENDAYDSFDFIRNKSTANLESFFK